MKRAQRVPTIIVIIENTQINSSIYSVAAKIDFNLNITYKNASFGKKLIIGIIFLYTPWYMSTIQILPGNIPIFTNNENSIKYTAIIEFGLV